MLLLALSLSPVKAADYYFAHSAGTYNFNYVLWKLNASNGNLVQTLISGVPAPVSGMAYFNGYLWAHSAGTYNLSYQLWKIDPTNGSVVQALTSGVTAPVGGMTYANGYFWAHSASFYNLNHLLWKLNPTNGTVVQTLTSGVSLPVAALAYANGYLWAHSAGTSNFNYVLWKINPANGTVAQTLTSGVPAAIGGLASADGYLWAHSANPYNFNYALWKINPNNGNVVQTLTSGAFLPVGALTFMEGTPPTGSISVNSGAEFANSALVNLTLSATDNSGTVSFMRFSNDNSAWSPWEGYATSKTWALAPGDGAKTTYVQFQDQTGNISSPSSDSIILDTVAPTGTITINSGAVLTTNRSVTLSLDASDRGSGVSQMRFSNDNSSWDAWEAYTTGKAWILASGDGSKTAYVQFKDTAGNGSSSFSATIRFYMDGGVPTNITIQASSNSLELSWPPDHTGWRLQVQTNSVISNWSDWPGATTTNRVKILIVPANRAVFFRNVYP
jgi:hypothetical protein